MAKYMVLRSHDIWAVLFKYFGTKNRYYFENWQYLKFSKFIKLRSISLVQSSVLSWFWHYCLGLSGYLFSIRHCSFGFWSSKSFDKNAVCSPMSKHFLISFVRLWSLIQNQPYGKEIYAHKRTYTYSHIYEGGGMRENCKQTKVFPNFILFQFSRDDFYAAQNILFMVCM
jgi:hypothetical protein